MFAKMMEAKIAINMVRIALADPELKKEVIGLVREMMTLAKEVHLATRDIAEEVDKANKTRRMELKGMRVQAMKDGKCPECGEMDITKEVGKKYTNYSCECCGERVSIRN